jgi:hypothetical protein
MAVIARGLHATLRTDRALHKRVEAIQWVPQFLPQALETLAQQRLLLYDAEA